MSESIPFSILDVHSVNSTVLISCTVRRYTCRVRWIRVVAEGSSLATPARPDFLGLCTAIQTSTKVHVAVPPTQLDRSSHLLASLDRWLGERTEVPCVDVVGARSPYGYMVLRQLARLSSTRQWSSAAMRLCFAHSSCPVLGLTCGGPCCAWVCHLPLISFLAFSLRFVCVCLC